jgi:hypothetical protein
MRLNAPQHSLGSKPTGQWEAKAWRGAGHRLERGVGVPVFCGWALAEHCLAVLPLLLDTCCAIGRLPCLASSHGVQAIKTLHILKNRTVDNKTSSLHKRLCTFTKHNSRLCAMHRTNVITLSLIYCVTLYNDSMKQHQFCKWKQCDTTEESYKKQMKGWYDIYTANTKKEYTQQQYQNFVTQFLDSFCDILKIAKSSDDCKSKEWPN